VLCERDKRIVIKSQSIASKTVKCQGPEGFLTSQVVFRKNSLFNFALDNEISLF